METFLTWPLIHSADLMMFGTIILTAMTLEVGGGGGGIFTH